MKITVYGGGSWGTAIARLLSNNKHEVKFYIRNKDIVDEINSRHENSKYLPGVDLGDLTALNDSDKALEDMDMLVMAVPTSAFRKVLTNIKDKIDKKVIILNLAKGIENETLDRISEISKEILPDNPFAVLSGPSHAEEVGKDIPTAVAISSENEEVAKRVQHAFASKYFRVYTNSDLLGVELCGALKNIIALAAGMADGLGFGDNTIAALATRGIYEISKLGVKTGAKMQTFNGLAGIGDLIVTCTSMHSRNRRAGVLIGKGIAVEDANKQIGQVVEGIKTTKSAYELSKKYDVSMPITAKLYEVLYEGLDPKEAVTSLMTREYKEEIEEMFLI